MRGGWCWPGRRRAAARRGVRRGLGRSFQDARLFPSLTVDETIAVALERWVEVGDPLSAAVRLNALDSERAIARRVDQLVELLRSSDHRSLFVRELSTGTRRVVDLACLLAHQPRVVLLDEPAAGIAQRSRAAAPWSAASVTRRAPAWSWSSTTCRSCARSPTGSWRWTGAAPWPTGVPRRAHGARRRVRLHRRRRSRRPPPARPARRRRGAAGRAGPSGPVRRLADPATAFATPARTRHATCQHPL